MRMTSALVRLVWLAVVFSVLWMHVDADFTLNQKQKCIIEPPNDNRTRLISSAACPVDPLKLRFNVSEVPPIVSYPEVKFAFEVKLDKNSSGAEYKVEYTFGTCKLTATANNSLTLAPLAKTFPTTTDFKFNLGLKKGGYEYHLSDAKPRDAYNCECDPFDKGTTDMITFEQKIISPDGKRPNITLLLTDASSNATIIDPGSAENVNKTSANVTEDFVDNGNASVKVDEKPGGGNNPLTDEEGGIKTWVIAVIAIGVVLVVAIAVVAGVLIFKNIQAKNAAAAKANAGKNEGSSMGTVTTGSQMTTAGTTVGNDEQINVVVQQ